MFLNICCKLTYTGKLIDFLKAQFFYDLMVIYTHKFTSSVNCKGHYLLFTVYNPLHEITCMS